MPVLIVICLFLLHPLSHAAEVANAPLKRITVMTWNLENLFDTEDDPDNPGDDEFTPGSWRRWNDERYQQKLANLSTVIGAVKPDILFVQEIENRRVLEDLSKTLKAQAGVDLPVIVHRNSPDQRGIDTAILARWEPSAQEWITPTRGQREMVVATFDCDGAPVTFICCHWKSNSGTDAKQNAMTRTIEARALRRYVDKNLKPGDSFVVGGDFNDDITSIILTEAGGLTVYENTPDEDATLLNMSGVLPESERGTYYYFPQKRWNSFDSFSVSAGMLPDATENKSPWSVVLKDYGPFKHPEFLADDQSPKPYRRVRSKAFDGYYLGASDHFPVRMILERRPDVKTKAKPAAKAKK